MESPAQTQSPREWVAAMIRDSLRSAEVTDLIEPEDPAPPHPEWDFDPRFFTPLQAVRGTWPFREEKPGVPTFRDSLLHTIREIRRTLQRHGITPRDCKAYLPAAHERDAAIVYFRLDGFVFAAQCGCSLDQAPDHLDSIWDLTLSTNVADEALPFP
jgi:hypothetical protein